MFGCHLVLGIVRGMPKRLHYLTETLDRSPARLFLATLAALFVCNVSVLARPPYWDSIVGLHIQAIWLVDHTFDFAGLFQEPGYYEGGPNVRPWNAPALLIAFLYCVLPPSVVFLLLHLLTLAAAAAIVTVCYLFLRRHLKPTTSAAWCIAGIANPIFSGQCAAIYLEIPLAMCIALVVYFIVNDRNQLATLTALPAFFIKETFILTSTVLIVWVIYRRVTPRFIGTSANRPSSTIYLLLLAPAFHYALLFFSAGAGSGSGTGNSLTFQPLAFGQLAYEQFPDQALLLMISVPVSVVVLRSSVKQRKTGSDGLTHSLVALGLVVWGFWGFMSIYYHPLCRYSVSVLLPLFCLCGLLITHVAGNRLSICVATVFIGIGLVNQYGWLLPKLSAEIARSGDRLERSREYLLDQDSLMETSRRISDECRGATIVAKYPMLQMLTMPRLGYVAEPMEDVRAVGITPTYAPCRPFQPSAPYRRLVAVYSPTVFEVSWKPTLQPESDSRVIIEDRRLDGALVVYEMTKNHPTIGAGSTEAIETAVQSQPTDAKLRFRLGVILLSHGRLDEAVSELSSALELGYDEADCRYNWGLALIQGGQILSGIEQYQRCVHVNPNHISGRIDLGNALYAIHKSDEALVHFEHVLQLEPGHASAHYNMANALLFLGRESEAREHYKRAVESAPSDSRLATAVNRKLEQLSQ